MPAPSYRRFLPRRSSADELETAAHTDYAPYRKKYYIRVPLRSGEEIGIGWSPGEPWLDVWARSRLGSDAKGHYTGSYHRHGFAPSGDRWSYAQGPPGAREMRRIIYALFRATAEGVEFVDQATERDRRWREGRRIEEGVNASDLSRTTQRRPSTSSTRKRVAPGKDQAGDVSRASGLALGLQVGGVLIAVLGWPVCFAGTGPDRLREGLTYLLLGSVLFLAGTVGRWVASD